MKEEKREFTGIAQCIVIARETLKIDVTEEKLIWLLRFRRVIDEWNMVSRRYRGSQLFANKTHYKGGERKEADLLLTTEGLAWMMRFIKRHKMLFEMFKD
jgi:hypothetical protein